MRDLAVLIPAYNDQVGLERTLASIDEADNSFTVVVVDDGSDPPVSLDPERYPFRIELLKQEQNGGIVKALNTGLEFVIEAGCKFVARLDAADLNRPGRFEQQYKRMSEDKGLCLLGSNAVFRNETDEAELFVTKLPTTHAGAQKWMVFRNCFIHPTVMLRVECLAEIGLYDANFPHIEDYVLFSRITEKFRTENIEEPLVDCFVREGGISMRHAKQQMLSGLKFRWKHPRPLNPLWYAYIAKRLAYLVVPFKLRNGLKGKLGFVKRSAEPASGAELTGTIRSQSSREVPR
jgi:glycosyltransferase involved in cell wall biosynthesis